MHSRDYPIGQIVNMVGNQQNTNLVENGLVVRAPIDVYGISVTSLFIVLHLDRDSLLSGRKTY